MSTHTAAKSDTLTVHPLADGTYALRNAGRDIARYRTAEAAQHWARTQFGADAPVVAA